MALPAAQAALAAGNQGKFWEYHDKVFENYNTLTDALLEDLARQTGLNLEKFRKDMDAAASRDLINRDLREGSRVGVRGTPTLFLNGKPLTQRTLETISAAVEAEAGTARSR